MTNTDTSSSSDPPAYERRIITIERVDDGDFTRHISTTSTTPTRG